LRVSIIILVVGLLPGSTAAQTAPIPRFEAAPCASSPPPSLVEGTDYRCGFVVVPENWAAAAPRTIRLAVMVVKSQAARPAPAPIVFLSGGPGEPGTAYAAGVYASLWALNRDIIFVDQRGAGLSQPGLACPEVDRAATRVLEKRLTGAAATKAQTDALKACRTRLVKAGVDLNAYRTVQSAADIAALRIALGYQTVNLYGLSYGTQLAQEVMRSFPEGIRSVVLDSVFPPSSWLAVDDLRAVQYAFTHVFERCAAAPSCNRRYPHLRSVFLDMVKRLDSKPRTLAVWVPSALKKLKVTVTGTDLAAGIYLTLKSGAISSVPYDIWQAAHGDMGPAANLASLALTPTAGLSQGMYLSVICAFIQPYPTAGGSRSRRKSCRLL
jgi:pimeloyl-ACP methyl ester carboxylesterase